MPGVKHAEAKVRFPQLGISGQGFSCGRQVLWREAGQQIDDVTRKAKAEVASPCCRFLDPADVEWPNMDAVRASMGFETII
jgi:hypothetical protein